MAADPKPNVVFVPGGVMPGEMAYGPLLEVIGQEIRPIVKELEVYATDSPPPDYSLQLEVDGIARVADKAGAASFHLVGYSAGGASSLAFLAQHPERVTSLALIEPAWTGSTAGPDAADWNQLRRFLSLPADERMRSFLRWQMREGLDPTPIPLPPGPPPPWMSKRPAGLVAVVSAFDAHVLDEQSLRQYAGPVYYALGTLSTAFYDRQAKRLAGIFRDFVVEAYQGRSHLDPPHRAEPERFARALRQLWTRAEEGK